MSLQKAVEHGKEHRTGWKYNFAKRVDPMCRNHGGCKWCEDGRKHKYKKAELKGKGYYE